MIDVAVIGGGVSGLATAYTLRQQGFHVAVLERQVRAGGNALSERFDGFLMEHGPSTVNPAVPEALALASAVGLESRRCDLGPDVRRRYLASGGRLKGLCIEPWSFMTSDYLSLAGRLRVLLEAFIPKGGDTGDETVLDFAARRFGRQFAERVIEPMVAGMFAGRAADLSVAAIFPKLLEMERTHGSITRAVLAAKNKKSMPHRRLFSWDEGVGSLPRALAEAMPGRVHTGVAVQRISRLADGFHIKGAGQSLRARAVVLATQPHVAAELLGGLDPLSAEALASVQAPPLAVVYLGYRRTQVGHPLDGLGFLLAPGEGRLLSGAQFCSTMFRGRAPDGHVSIAGYVGGARDPKAALRPSDELIEGVRGELSGFLGIKGDPVVARVRQWPRGLPQYPLGHGDRVTLMASAHDRQPGLFITGNFIAGPSVSVCVAQAGKTAAAVAAYLGEATGLSVGVPQAL